MSVLNVGDTVYVYDWGAKFPIYEAWFIKQLESYRKDFDIRWAIRFDYGVSGEVSPRDVTYKILYLNGNMALITKEYGTNTPVYLISIDALGKRRRMTKKEIEEEFGIEIIGE